MEAIVANIQNALLSGMFGVFFAPFFAQNNYKVLLGSFLIRFREFCFLTPSDDFAKAKASAWRPFLPIVKIVSFLEY